MLAIKVRLYGTIRRLIGKKELTFKVKENSTVESIVRHFIKAYGAKLQNAFRKYPIDQASHLGNTLILLNGTNVYLLKDRYKHKLKKNDTLSIIPIASGG